MNKPDFLPFRDTAFTEKQALLAGAYLLYLDTETSFGNDIQAGNRIALELTGQPTGTAQRTELQHRIIGRVAHTLDRFVGSRREINPEQIVRQINATIGA